MFNFRYTAVQLMGSGMTPSKAALFSIKPIINFYPEFNGAVIAVNTKGEHGKLQCTQFVELFNLYFTNFLSSLINAGTLLGIQNSDI